MPAISIIVPNYNHARFLPERLGSIFNQTFQDFEVILLDDNSSDNSRELLASYASHPKVTHVVINERNSGSTFKQWKKGIALSKSPLIWVAESDDVAHHSFLATLIPILQECPKVGVAYCQSQIIDEHGMSIGSNLDWTEELSSDAWNKQFQMDGKVAIEQYFIYKNIIPNASAVLFRKDIFIRISNLLEDFKFVGDWFTWVEMLSISDLYYTPRHLNFFRRHANVTRNRKTPERRMQYFLEVYSLLNQIQMSEEKREKVFDNMGKRVCSKFGIRVLLSPKGFAFRRKLSLFDPRFQWRAFSILLLGKLSRIFERR